MKVSSTGEIRVSDVIVEALSRAGVRSIFAVVGGASLHLLDAVTKNPTMRLVTTHHEQAAAMAADSFSRVSGTLGVAIATSGPGATNLLTGIAGCFYDSVPTLFITGQVSTTRQSGTTGTRQIGFQETPIVAMASPIVKYATELTDPCKVLEEIEKCIYIAREGRPGPVLLDIPDDVQRMTVNLKSLSGYILPSQFQPQVEIPIETLSKLVGQAKRPLLICGSGINLAGQRNLVKQFIAELGWPTLLTWGVADLLSYTSPENIGTFGTHGSRIGNFTAQNADLIISIGSRLDTKATGSPISNFSPGSKIVMIDIDESELNKFESFNKQIELKLRIDLRSQVFYEILSIIKENSTSIEDWKQFIQNSKSKIHEVRTPPQPGYVEPYRFFSKLSELLPDNSRVFIDTGCAIAWVMQSWAIRSEQRLFHDFNNTAMGWALPALCGSLIEDEQIPSYAIIGDGSLMMSLQELATLKSIGGDSIIFIINNSGYSMIKQTQDQWFDERYFASDANSQMGFPNFRDLALAFGIRYMLIESEVNLKEFILLNRKGSGHILCEVKISPLERVVPIVKYGSKIYDMDPKLSVEEMNEYLLDTL